MPFTPFHIGPATLIYSIFSKLDFIALLYGSTLIDIEPFLIMLLDLSHPLHGPIHSIVGVLAITPLIYFVTLITSGIFQKIGIPLRKTNQKVIVLSILVGGYSHIILDGFLYPEMNLAWPFSYWNPLFGAFSYGEVYGFCTMSFLAGLIFYAVKRIFFREKV